MLTAADVEQKTFSTALRGYDLDEVDDFLDEIVATIRDLTEKLEAAEASASRPSVASDEGSSTVQSTEQPVRALDESAVGRALIAAQSAADRLMEEAEQKAASIVQEAKIQADTWEDAREAKRSEAEAEIARIASRVATVRSELSVLADEVAVKLDDMDAVIEGRHAAGDRHDRATEEAREEDADNSSSDAEEDAAHPLEEMLNGVVTDLQIEEEDETDRSSSETEAKESDDDEAEPDDDD